ncbi:hypothetical protein LAZ67_14002306 [Cordylochernes scorpioides]|uniref:DUF5641 domain-containing protein n=1 Tax=Cordylochernes scorpioides TaxID=51811 RepID=A0ABY6L9H3_9ARAC|nr:hypothetical protein LAZ67_14002306 [Cordylochernes scorpioides]
MGLLPITVWQRTRPHLRSPASISLDQVRGIHLEVAHGLSTDEALMALSCFIDTRGRPFAIYSDNGTNFVDASREMKIGTQHIDFNEIAASGRFGPIEWKFIPPAARNFGGAWEWLIKLVKKCLYSILNENHPKDTTLLTALKSVENIVNHRPITYVSSDPTEEALTPNHFLRESNDAGPAIPRERTDPIRIGDLDFLVDEQHPKNMWKRGFISDVRLGKDEQVRVVKVTTKKGGKEIIYERSVSKVCPLGLKMDLPDQNKEIQGDLLHKSGAGMSQCAKTHVHIFKSYL